MNQNGLAMIVGGLVVIVAAIIYFGTDVMRRSGADHDVNVTIEVPKPAAPKN